MAGALSDLLAQVTGRNPEEEERIKKNAEQGIAQEEARTGEKFVDEPGIEPDEVTNTAIDLGTGGTSGLVRRVGSMAAGKATNAGLNKLKESGMPNKPSFHEAVAAGETKPGSFNFAKFIRGEGNSAPKAMNKPETLQVPRMGTNDKVKALQSERQYLNLKTPEGRDRLKEIDHMLKNRTYFEE